MDAPQPATILGFPFETWVGIATAALAAYAAITLTRRKWRALSALGDEPHKENESAADTAQPGLSRGPSGNPPAPNKEPEDRR